jgi:hypothetical protein
MYTYVQKITKLKQDSYRVDLCHSTGASIFSIRKQTHERRDKPNLKIANGSFSS